MAAQQCCRWCCSSWCGKTLDYLGRVTDPQSLVNIPFMSLASNQTRARSSYSVTKTPTKVWRGLHNKTKSIIDMPLSQIVFCFIYWTCLGVVWWYFRSTFQLTSNFFAIDIHIAGFSLHMDTTSNMASVRRQALDEQVAKHFALRDVYHNPVASYLDIARFRWCNLLPS